MIIYILYIYSMQLKFLAYSSVEERTSDRDRILVAREDVVVVANAGNTAEVHSPAGSVVATLVQQNKYNILTPLSAGSVLLKTLLINQPPTY